MRITSSTGSKTRFSIGLFVVDLFLIALVVGCSNSGHDSAFGSIQSLPTPKPILSHITQIQLNTLKSLYPDISILETSDIVFASHPAHKIIFTATDNTNHLRKAMQIWFKEDTRSYLITYKAEVESFPKYLSTIEKMLNSFYIIGKSSNLS